MGGALLLTSLAKARAAGIAEDKLVYPLGGASAEEPRDYLLRDQFYESHPQNAVLKAAMDLAGGDGKTFDAIELYSCFPCVPKMARRTLGLGADVQPTVTGGLTFFGAPLNTYMTLVSSAAVMPSKATPEIALRTNTDWSPTKPIFSASGSWSLTSITFCLMPAMISSVEVAPAFSTIISTERLPST